MPDEHAFIAHRTCGLATHFGKQLGNRWTFDPNAADRLADYLWNENSEAYWEPYGRESTEDPFVLLFEGMGGLRSHRGFKVTWTTPSGYLFSPSDYVDGKKDGCGIFRVIFLDTESADAP